MDLLLPLDPHARGGACPDDRRIRARLADPGRAARARRPRRVDTAADHALTPGASPGNIDPHPCRDPIDSAAEPSICSARINYLMRSAECGVRNAEWTCRHWLDRPHSRFDLSITIPHSTLRIPHFAL